MMMKEDDGDEDEYHIQLYACIQIYLGTKAS